MRLPIAVGLMCWSALAAASPPAPIKNGTRIHLKLAGHREEAVALHGDPSGWRVLVGGGDVVAELRDVTSGATLSAFEIKIVDGKLLLDRGRFLQDHAYRLDLRRGGHVIASSIVYLFPLPRGANKVVFKDSERSISDDDTIVATAKGSL